MKIAVLSDIHGNLAALGAVLEHLSKQQVDAIVVAGDVVVGAPDSAACWQLASSLGASVLRGNHETYLAHFDRPDAPAAWKTEQYAPVRWTLAQFSNTERRNLGALPLSVQLPSALELLFVHASLRSDRDNLDAYTSDEVLGAMFPGLTATCVVRGHDHIAATREWRGRQLITSGSVGIPLNAVTEAQYVTLEPRRGVWQPTFHSVPYDVDATLRRFHESGYLEAAGPMARLFYREIATATPQLIPFWQGYARYSEGGSLSLTASVRAFLRVGWP